MIVFNSMTFKQVLKEIFSGANGKLSAKRAVGGFSMLVALGCTIYLTVRDGSTSVVENLLMTTLISSISLLGLPAVTSMWGGSKLNIQQKQESEPPTEQPIKTQPIDPCENCPHNKKGTV